MVRISDIKKQFNTNDVEQVKTMQLFIVKGRYCNKYLLVSYHTIIGVLDEMADCWYISGQYHSRTTTRQVNYFKSKNFHIITSQNKIDNMLSSFNCL